jgi:hypothetical protein
MVISRLTEQAGLPATPIKSTPLVVLRVRRYSVAVVFRPNSARWTDNRRCARIAPTTRGTLTVEGPFPELILAPEPPGMPSSRTARIPLTRLTADARSISVPDTAG